MNLSEIAKTLKNPRITSESSQDSRLPSKIRPIVGFRPGLVEKGFSRDQMLEMQKIIDAEKSDLFDVQAHVAYAMPRSPARFVPRMQKS